MTRGWSGFFRRGLLAGVLAASAVLLQAEDAPPVEKKEAQAEPAAAAEAPADLSDPKTVHGKIPEFPLKSDKYDIIDDSYDNILNNFDNDRGEMEMEYGPMEDIMVALRATPQEELHKHINNEATFRKLMKTPEQFRGHVVKLVGILADTQGGPKSRDFLREGYPATPNLSGFRRVYKGQTTNANGEIVSFRSMEPLPEGIKPGQPVQLVGIFMKRFCYLNRESGRKVTWTPIVFVRRIEPYAAAEEISQTGSTATNLAALVVFLFIGGGAAAYFYSRMKYKAAAANYFTRLKNDREGGPQGIFPRKNPPKKKPAAKPGEKKEASAESKSEEKPSESGDKKEEPPAAPSAGEQGAPA
ncbi:MAG TPA: hypothetical protein VEJ63_16460 [Planctomycetota bacterium]|nr:hypothetical protein [Planctomycetota bacterium]